MKTLLKTLSCPIVGIALLCALCAGFVSCSEDDGDDEASVSESDWSAVLTNYLDGSTITLSSSLTASDLEEFAAALAESDLSNITLDMSNLTITTITSGTFANCTNITSIVLPASLVSIGESAFAGCTALTSVTIGASLVTVGENAFAGCTALALVTYRATADNWEAVSIASGNDCLTAATFVYSEWDWASILANYEDGDTITLFYSLTASDLEEFVEALKSTSLSNITVDMSNMTITQINDYTFNGCTNITSMVLPEGASIGEYAFYGCTNLASVTFGDGTTSIGSRAFYRCTALETVTIGSNVTTISEGAFYGCSSLATVNYNGTTSEWGEISISGTSSASGNYYLTRSSVTIICTDGEYSE